jgi:hypothetical protein
MLLQSFSTNPALCVPVVAIVCATIITVSAILAYHRRRTRLTELEVALKQDMLERGFSAEQIEQVLRASAGPVAKVETVSDNEYYLVEKLIDKGKSIEEVERTLKACKAVPEQAPRSREAIMTLP